MNSHADIQYDYMALFRGVVGLVLIAGTIIIAINYKWWPRGSKWLSAYLRERRGDVLTAGLLLTVIRVTILKHGGWLSATALLAMACGMAA